MSGDELRDYLRAIHKDNLWMKTWDGEKQFCILASEFEPGFVYEWKGFTFIVDYITFESVKHALLPLEEMI